MKTREQIHKAIINLETCLVDMLAAEEAIEEQNLKKQAAREQLRIARDEIRDITS